MPAAFPTLEGYAMDLDPSKPVVLLLGVGPEGVISLLKTAGRQFKIKLLDSRPPNWYTVLGLFEKYDVRCVLLNLTSGVYRRLADTQYEDVAHKLLTRIAERPHMVFAFEALAFPKESDASDAESDDPPRDYSLTKPDILHRGNTLLASHAIRVMPYRRNAELTVLASAFLSDTEDGLLFKCYVPKGRMGANEFDRLLQLFRDFLSRTRRSEIRLSEHRTNHGVIYKLLFADERGNRDETARDLSSEFAEFTQILHLSLVEPRQAESMLRAKDVAAAEIVEIVERYGKEARRLQIDMRQEKEKKLLSIRHRLETELSDTFADLGPRDLQGIVDDAVRQSDAGLLRAPFEGLSIDAPQPRSITVNVGSNVINAVNSVIAEEIGGDVRFGVEDRRILELIRLYAPKAEGELGSALRELGDDSAPHPDRLQARQKLKGFLYGLAGKVPDVGIGLLTAYLEKRLGLS